MATTSRNWLRVLVLVLLVGGLLGWFVYRQFFAGGSGFSWSQFAAVFGEMDWRWLGAAFGFILLTYFGRAIRWAALIQPICPHPGLWRLTRANIIGFTAVALFGRAGELVRPYLISQRENVSFSSQVAAWFLERIFDLLAVLLIFGVALTQIDPSSTAKVGPNLAWVLKAGGQAAGVIAVICFAILIAFRFFADQSRKRLRDSLAFLPHALQGRIGGIIDAFADGMATTKSNRQLFLIFAYTFIEWLIIVASFYCVCKAVPGATHLLARDVVVLLGFVAFGSVVQIPGVGGGMQFVTILVLTELYGVGLERATAVAIVLWLVSFMSIVPVGLVMAFQDGLSWAKLRSVKEEEPTPGISS